MIPVFRDTLALIVVVVLLGGLAVPVHAQMAVIEQVLESTPQSLDVHGGIYEGRQAISNIPTNIETLYGIGCVLEDLYDDENRTDGRPSKEWDYAPLEVDESTSLRQFLDHACSEGKLEWGIVYGAIHVRPAATRSRTVSYLDTIRISLDLQGVSLLEAAKAWGEAVNTNRLAGAPAVRVRHAFVVGDPVRPRATPESLTRRGAVTLKLDNVTARDALCAIQGASIEWVRITYLTRSISPRDSVTFFPSKAEIKTTSRVTPEEREALNAQEDLESVLVEPAAAGAVGAKHKL